MMRLLWHWLAVLEALRDRQRTDYVSTRWLEEHTRTAPRPMPPH